MKSLKKTTFLEAVAAAIDHEVKCFQFYLKTSESLPEGPVRELFSQLALDGDEHIKFIREVYKNAEGKELPNLKQLSEIEKFHSSTIQKLMDKLDRNKAVEVNLDEKKALELAIREGDDARDFYSKIRNKFQDPKINLLFQKLSNFSETNNSLLEAQARAMEQSNPDQVFYWEDEELLAQVTPVVKKTGTKSESAPKKKTVAPSKKKSVASSKPKTKTVAKKKAVKKAAKKAVKKAQKKAAQKKTKPAKKKGKKK